MTSILIWICWIRWWCSLFLFWIENTLLGKIWSKKIKSICVRSNLVRCLIRICSIRWSYSLFLVSTNKRLLGQFWLESQNCLGWKLVPKLISAGGNVHLPCFGQKLFLRTNLVQKLKTGCLRWRLESIENTLFRQIRSKKTKFSVWDDNWYLD